MRERADHGDRRAPERRRGWIVAWLARLGSIGLLVGAPLSVAVAPALAHESEQYSLPAGRDFADLGPHFSRLFRRAVEDAVADTNAAIDKALEEGLLPMQVEALQSPGYVAGRVWGRLFAAVPTNELLDLGLLAEPLRAQYPGLVTMYRPVESIYDDALLVADLSKSVRTFFRAGTVSAGGMLFGTDKIVHFLQVGRIYHALYLGAVERGVPPHDAVRLAIDDTTRNPLLSEEGFLGLYTTGIRSNADLAADYAGLAFYRNLTETVRFGSRELPPMLVRAGAHWRVQALPDAAFFTVFVTPHWNEVLNPNRYLDYVGRRVREVIRERCGDVADWYRDVHGRPMGHDEFVAAQRALATLHGEDYGHQLDAQQPVDVASSCFPAQPPGRSAAIAGAPTRVWWAAVLAHGAADDLGRSALWHAAAAGDAEAVDRLAARGDALDAADVDGQTPLHAAVRAGHGEAVRLLLARGADPDRGALYGVSPLMLAVSAGDSKLAEALLAAGANPDRQDLFGRTALHEAALRGDLSLTAMLLAHGADPALADHFGGTPLRMADLSGNEALTVVLRQPPVPARMRSAGPLPPARTLGSLSGDAAATPALLALPLRLTADAEP